MTAPTIRDALEVAIRFVPTRTRALELRYRVEGETASLTLEERADFGEARDVVLVALVVGIWRIAQSLTGRTLVGDVDFSIAPPGYAERFGAWAPGAVRFGQPTTRLVFDAALLDTPLSMADPAAHRRACEQCERELEALTPRLDARVRAALDASPPPTLDEVARALGASTRTLKRRLRDEGTSFGALRKQVFLERALLLLDQGHGLEQCAEALGYSDAASFSRAFKRWTGDAPGRSRRKS